VNSSNIALHLVPTPIGNLKDITFRAIEILKEVDVILAEDTRVTKKLLTHYNIETTIRSYHAHNEHRIHQGIIDEMLKGSTFALVTDAGTPAISDPGFLLVRACYQSDIIVSALPGATALTTAVSASGLPADRFHFEGFLPHKKGRNKRLEFLKEYPYTIVLYESPYRLIKTIKDIQETYGTERNLCVVKELSKIYESFTLSSISEHLERLEKEPKIRGEYVIVIGPPENSNKHSFNK